jgi:segregation and condensation protein A
MQGITARLRPGERITFVQLFEGQRTRGSVVITFLALLEMVKLRLLRVNQDEGAKEIWVSAEAGALEGENPEVDESEYS